MNRHCLIAALAAFWVILAGNGQAPGQEPKAKAKLALQRVPEGVKAVRDIDYVGKGLARQKLDLFVPDREGGPWPLVVWVHGGGWQAGSKEANRALFLSGRGFAVASLNYRLVDAGPFPIQIEDCRAAVRWLRANASTHRLDPDRIGAWGGSAGGHLVALLGTAGDAKGWDDVGAHRDVSARVQAVCDFFGPADFGGILDSDRPIPANGPLTRLLGGPPREKRDVARAASPVTYVSRDDPPFLIVHGDHDTTVPLRQSRTLTDRLKEAGVEVTLQVVKNGRHGNWGPDAEPNTQAINEQVAAFFEKHLKNGRAQSEAGKTR